MATSLAAKAKVVVKLVRVTKLKTINIAFKRTFKARLLVGFFISFEF